MSRDGAVRLLRDLVDEPTLLEFPEARIFNQASQVVLVDDVQRPGYWQARQEHLLLAGRVLLLAPARDHDRIDGIGLEALAVRVLLLVSAVAILVVAQQTFYPDDFDALALVTKYSLRVFLPSKPAGVFGSRPVLASSTDLLDANSLLQGPPGLTRSIPSIS